MPRIAFVIVAAETGTMIVNRLDFRNIGPDAAVGIGAEVLERGAYEEGEVGIGLDFLARLRALRGDGVVAVDGGANIGTHAVTWARAMRGWGSVIAIEPQERVFYALAGNITINNCFNARAIWAALSDRTGTIRMPRIDHLQPANFGGLSLKPGVEQDPGQEVDFGDGAEEVRSIRLDDLMLERLDFLKLDIEGMEAEALAGAEKTVARCRPVILVETMISGTEAVAARLPGYRLIGAGMNALAIHEEDEILKTLQLVNA